MFTDWIAYFWPQIITPWMLSEGIFNLPWFFVVLQVLRPLGMFGALVVVEIATALVVLALCKRLGLTTWRTVMVMLSPPVLVCLVLGQIDGMLLVAYLVPAWLSVPLAIVKPQAAVAACLRSLHVERDGLRVNRRAWIVAVALVVSAFLVWGWPFACRFDRPGGPVGGWTWSYWPWGMLLAVELSLFGGLPGRLFASPHFFKYANMQSMIGPMLYAATLPGWTFVLIWIGAWISWIGKVDFVDHLLSSVSAGF